MNRPGNPFLFTSCSLLFAALPRNAHTSTPQAVSNATLAYASWFFSDAHRPVHCVRAFILLYTKNVYRHDGGAYSFCGGDCWTFFETHCTWRDTLVKSATVLWIVPILLDYYCYWQRSTLSPRQAVRPRYFISLIFARHRFIYFWKYKIKCMIFEVGVSGTWKVREPRRVHLPQKG